MTEDRIGKKVRIILVGNRYYSGRIVEEDVNTLTFIDKFGSCVSVGKKALVSLEVLE